MAIRELLLLGVVRDGGPRLRERILQIDAAFERFDTRHWLVVESDSRDDTLAVLEGMARERRNLRVMSLGKLARDIPERTARIARARNAALARLRRETVYDGVGFVAIADLDGVNDELRASAVNSCFLPGVPDWDVVTANQRGRYYDIWALRHPVWSPNDCWAQYRFLRAHGRSKTAASFAAVYARMVTLPVGGPWVEVDSAFGGLAIYRRAVLRHGHYVGMTPQGDPVCEHVPFHEALRERGARIFINPSLVNAGATDHSDPLRRFRRWWSERRDAAHVRRGGGATLDP